MRIKGFGLLQRGLSQWKFDARKGWGYNNFLSGVILGHGASWSLVLCNGHWELVTPCARSALVDGMLLMVSIVSIVSLFAWRFSGMPLGLTGVVPSDTRVP